MRKTLQYKLTIWIEWRHFEDRKNKYTNDIKTAEKKYRLTKQKKQMTQLTDIILTKLGARLFGKSPYPSFCVIK